jgi:unspecific monooxygenase
MRRWFWAFGSGGRMCVGSNLALQGMPRKSSKENTIS